MLYGKRISGVEETKHVRKITAMVHTLERTVAAGADIVDFLHFMKDLPAVVAPFKREAKALGDFEYSYFRDLLEEGKKVYSTKDNQHQDGPQPLIRTMLNKKDNWDLDDFERAYVLGTLYEGGSGTTSAAMQSFCLVIWHYPEWQVKL